MNANIDAFIIVIDFSSLRRLRFERSGGERPRVPRIGVVCILVLDITYVDLLLGFLATVLLQAWLGLV